jgi:hypothetical protein
MAQFSEWEPIPDEQLTEADRQRKREAEQNRKAVWDPVLKIWTDGAGNEYASAEEANAAGQAHKDELLVDEALTGDPSGALAKQRALDEQNVNDVYRRNDATAGGIVDQYIAGPDAADTINPAIADITATQDANQISRSRSAQQQIAGAQGNQQELLDRVLSGPSTARAVAEQMAAEQRAQALSARGGAGAVQAAQAQVAANAPKLQQQAALSAIQEEQVRNQTATALTGQQAQTALISEQNDIRIKESNQRSADNLINNVAQLKAIETQINSNDKQALGQLQRDLAKWVTDNEAQWAQLGVTERVAMLDGLVTKYGFSVQASSALTRLNAQLAAAEPEKIDKILGRAENASNIVS